MSYRIWWAGQEWDAEGSRPPSNPMRWYGVVGIVVFGIVFWYSVYCFGMWLVCIVPFPFRGWR